VAADFTVLVLGARTGGTTALADAIESADVVLLWDGAKLHKAPPDEATVMLALRRHPEAIEFDDPPQAAQAAAMAAQGWWQARRAHGAAAAHDPDPPVLREWERRWLNGRIESWRRGRHGPLASHGQGQRIERAAIYVPLHAERADAWIAADGTLHLMSDGKCHRRHRASDDRIMPPGERGDDTRPAPLERVLAAPGGRIWSSKARPAPARRCSCSTSPIPSPPCTSASHRPRISSTSTRSAGNLRPADSAADRSQRARRLQGAR
jgi:hypothetical protein